jgi:hypothetical protein
MQAHRRVAELTDRRFALEVNGLTHSDEYAAVVAELRDLTEERFTRDPNLNTFLAHVETAMDGPEIVTCDATTWGLALDYISHHCGVPSENVRPIHHPTEEQLGAAIPV